MLSATWSEQHTHTSHRTPSEHDRDKQTFDRFLVVFSLSFSTGFPRDKSAETCQIAERVEGEQLSSYFRGRMEESELRGAVATSQLWQPAEVLSWVNTYVLCVRSFGKGREEVKLLQELWKMCL